MGPEEIAQQLRALPILLKVMSLGSGTHVVQITIIYTLAPGVLTPSSSL